MTTDHSLGDGIFFNQDDYAGFTRRVIVMLIDSFVLILLSFATLIAMTFAETIWPDTDFTVASIFGSLVLAWIYLTVLKRSRFRTLGYRLADLRITTTTGVQPSLLTMTFRMLMWGFGPVNFLMDLVWIAADTERQTIRDCLAGTYVVRQNAHPAGTAPMHLARYCGLGLTLAYPRVVHHEPTV